MFKAKDFMIGWELGKDAQEQRKQNRLREGLKQLDEQQVEEIKTPQAADPNTEQSKMLAAQNEGLTNELPPTPVVTGYQYGDQTFKYKPPAELISALKADRRAALFEQHGDIDKAQVLREAAVKQRATAIQGIMDRAVRSGRLEDMFAGYSLIDDGYDASFERGKVGSITAYWWDQANPDKRSVAFTAANEQEARQRIMDMMDPELSSKLADAETNRALRQAQIQNMEETRGLRQDYNSERLMIQKQQQLQQQANYWTEVANRATSEGEYVQAMQQRDTAMRQLSGIGGGGLSGAPTPGSPQAGTIPPRAIFDYLVSQKGIDPVKALGVVASAEQESGFNPTATHDNGTGYGLFGHRLDRRDQLFQHAGNPNPSWMQQIDYLITEPEMQDYLGGNYGNDYGLAAKQFTRLVERPKNTELRAAERAGLARNYEAYLANAPQPGTSNAPAPSTPSGTDYGAQFRARQEAARMPKPGKEPSVAEMIQLRNAAIEELGTTLESIKKPEERQRLISQKMDEIRGDIGAGGYDANASMGQIVKGGGAGTAKDKPGGEAGGGASQTWEQASSEVAGKKATQAQSKAVAAEQARFGAMLADVDKRWVNVPVTAMNFGLTNADTSYGTKQQAINDLQMIEGLWKTGLLTPKDQQLARKSLDAIYGRYPELRPKTNQ